MNIVKAQMLAREILAKENILSHELYKFNEVDNTLYKIIELIDSAKFETEDENQHLLKYLLNMYIGSLNNASTNLSIDRPQDESIAVKES